MGRTCLGRIVLPSGPFAILPLSAEQSKKHRSAIVWTEKKELAEVILNLSSRDFTNEFKRRFGEHLGRFDFFGPREAYPLSMQYAETCIENRLALVGDAAHGIHPIAGQGLNLGLRDVRKLHKLVNEYLSLGLELNTLEFCKFLSRL